jgi:hypothetical protein
VVSAKGDITKLRKDSDVETMIEKETQNYKQLTPVDQMAVDLRILRKLRLKE